MSETESFNNGTNCSNSTENCAKERKSGEFPWNAVIQGSVWTLIALIQAICWSFLCYRNRKQRRMRAEQRAKNLENQRNGGLGNPAGYENPAYQRTEQQPWYTSSSVVQNNYS